VHVNTYAAATMDDSSEHILVQTNRATRAGKRFERQDGEVHPSVCCTLKFRTRHRTPLANEQLNPVCFMDQRGLIAHRKWGD